jgi:LmbE family N-acetylglucosaminyl deacetylase
VGLAGSVVLAVFAHPDDESLACGGTLAQLARAGAHVVVMCASHGERGSNHGTERDSRLGCERAVEMRDAAAALGVREVHLLLHPDGDLRWADVGLFNAELMLFLRARRPAAVITFGEDGLYWHPDHIGVHEQTVMALRALGSSAPPLYGVTMPGGAMRGLFDAAGQRGWRPPADGFWSLNPDAWGAHAPEATMDLDVADWVTSKVAAIVSHASQVGVAHPLSILDPATLKRWLGRELFHPIPSGTSTPPVSDILGHLL